MSRKADYMGFQTRNVYRQFYRVFDGAVPYRHSELCDAFGVIVGALEDPLTVEAALALVVFGQKLVGVDWADVLALADDQVGLARVVPRVTDLAAELFNLLVDLASQGYGDRFMLIQLFSCSDEALQDLKELDDLVTKVFRNMTNSVIFTSIFGWIFSRTILIGFGPGHPTDVSP